MTKEKIQQLINAGYSILNNGTPEVVNGDLWEYLDRLDEEDTSVLVLEDLLNWREEELKGLKF